MIIRDEVWRDNAGNKIAVSDMSEDYAKNVLRMILRNHRETAAMEKMFSDYCKQLLDQPAKLGGVLR